MRAGRQVEAVGQATKEILVRVGCTRQEVPGDSEGTSESGRASGNGQSSNGGAPSDNTKRHHSGNGSLREGENTGGSRGPEERVIQRAIGSLDLSVDKQC